MRAVIAQYPDTARSDDRVFTTGNAIIMLDGASAFVPVPVPAGAYVDHLGRQLQQALRRRPDEELTSVLSAAISHTALNLNLSAGRSPSSTVTIVRAAGDRIDLLVLGDNIVILPNRLVTDDGIDRIAPDLRREYRERLAAGHGYDTRHRELLAQLQAEQIQMRNRPRGYWVAETDPEAARHAITIQRTVADTPWAILATDGAYNTMRQLGLCDSQSLITAGPEDLARVLRQCQDWEAATDPTGQRLPRAKRHDDKSLAVLTLDAPPGSSIR